MEADDARFVFSTWTKYLQASSAYWRSLESKMMPAAHRLIAATLARPSCRAFVGVAAPAGEAEIIVGYLIADCVKETPVIHFGFVKDAFRGAGVMRRLLVASGINPNEAALSHPTRNEVWIQAKWPGLELLNFFK